MSAASDYETKLEDLLQQCDTSIEESSTCVRNTSAGARQACEEEINVLIANRESLRRGLLRAEDAGCLCSSCQPKSVTER